jgi:hypothetical protein
MAAIAYQRPMRVAIHARTMLADAPDASLLVTHVGRSNDSLTELAGDGWQIGAAAAADAIARGAMALFVAAGDGSRVKLVVAPGGTIRAEGEGEGEGETEGDAHALLDLPEIAERDG